MENSSDRIELVDLQVEMARSYLDYAMSVIVGRALPDVRDGLKPVHRRVLYAMFDAGYRPDKGYYKSSRVVGDVMGNYHPHGDTAIYDTLVRLAQPWSLRYPLVDGNGNFGSPGNDPAAAMRYTEARLAPLAIEMMRDIDEETVDFTDNYDGRSQEPVVLPSRFPNLLVNGSAGIAVGMATNIPPHNLNEVAEGIQWSLKNPDAKQEELLEKLLTFVKGPDFPTKGLIVGRSGIEEAYRTGRGSITMRAVVEVEEINGRTCLVISELPYQVNPDNLALKIADLVKDGKVAGIADVRDEGNERLGQRLVVVLKKDAVAKVVLNNLYKHTQLQETFGANMLALVDGVPRTLRLDEFVRFYIDHQIEVIVRRTKFRLAEKEKRAHILRGYVKALDALDDVIALIRKSESTDDARSGLMKLLDVDEIQANAILDMQLRRLAALERQKIQDEYDAIMKEIVELNEILASPKRQREIISSELAELTGKYGDSRRTQIIAAEGDFAAEDLIKQEDVVVTITRGGYAKRTRADLYRSQRRGGRGKQATATKEDDWIDQLFIANTHDYILCFSNRGRLYWLKVWEVPEGSRNSRGRPIVNMFPLTEGEKINVVLPLTGESRSFPADHYVFMATAGGTVKKTALDEFSNPRKAGIIAVDLDEGDYLIGAALTDGKHDVMLFSDGGKAVRFDENDVRPMGRNARGVRGMMLEEGQGVIAMLVAEDEQQSVLTATENGYGKRTSIVEYTRHGRGTKGMIAIQQSERNGKVVAATLVHADDEIMLITDTGVLVRTRVAEIREMGRATQGVTLISLDEGAKLSGLQRIVENDANEAMGEESGEEAEGDTPEQDQ